MKTIHFDNPHRKKHFALFNGMNHPHFNITANVDLTNFLKTLKKRELAFTPAMVYLICRAANGIEQFRWRIRGEAVVEHDLVHPSFTVPTKASDVFSFCYADYHAVFDTFFATYEKAKQNMLESPSMEDEPGRDDYLFLSAMPWISFTGIQHAMPNHPTDSVPRIVWGKYFEEQGKVKMPLSVQAHHAVVDGWHVGQYFELFQKLLEGDFKN